MHKNQTPASYRRQGVRKVIILYVGGNEEEADRELTNLTVKVGRKHTATLEFKINQIICKYHVAAHNNYKDLICFKSFLKIEKKNKAL